MTLTSIIKKLLKKNNTTKYTFKKADHEVVLLKKLEDDTIFYNNTIYEKNFLYYHKLDAFIQQIYDLRNEYIHEKFNILNSQSNGAPTPVGIITIGPKASSDQYFFIRFKNKLKKKVTLFFNNLKSFFFVPPMEVAKFDPNESDEISNLTLSQYEILVKAYKYEFEYQLKFDLVNPDIKLDNLTFKPLVKEFFYDWFYIVGWRSIKPVYPTFSPSLHYHYEDAREDKLVFRSRYNPLYAGMRPYVEFLEEYDEQKKFNEFDINCKTNSYYTRYIPYNEIYNKNYPEEKKFKIDLIHDFTPEEINENYNNMIDKGKSALEKFNFVILNPKNREAVLKFFEELEIIEVTQEKRVYWQGIYWKHFEDDEDSNIFLAKKIESLLYDLLNNPRYILVMPLVDAYFEVFRSKGWYFEDESFLDQKMQYLINKKYYKYLMYFDFSYERQYFFAKNHWLTTDYFEIEDAELEEDLEDSYEDVGFGLAVFFWLILLNFYLIFCWLFLPFVPRDILVDYSKTLGLAASGGVEMGNLFTREYRYGFHLRRPRSRILSKIGSYLPLKYYDTGYYSYNRQRVRLNIIPMSILDQLSFDLNEKDFGLDSIHKGLFAYGRRHLFWKLRIPYIEENYPFWTPQDPSPWEVFKKKCRTFFQDSFIPWFMNYIVPSGQKFFSALRDFEETTYIQTPRKFIHGVKHFFNELKAFMKELNDKRKNLK